MMGDDGGGGGEGEGTMVDLSSWSSVFQSGLGLCVEALQGIHFQPLERTILFPSQRSFEPRSASQVCYRDCEHRP